ncbi:MAG: response regulator [Chloroflexi bacterium]|uniref:histidine kinase n=1 Tax=Candidatus Chlorohelix allophototropha TaxID=3003348 RepID=A0A8T7M953_9CHLR|nr:response regulator [Chloroflexota bacterium]WJW68487.1 response regulator [Chloroflexota bacterium L227-S17]
MADELILVVDDEEIIRKQAEAVLRKAGFRVLTAPDGKSALELIKQQPFALMLSDIRMPDMDGLQLFTSARKLVPDLIAVLMTAHGTIDVVIKAMQLGVQGFLQKPFASSELERVINDALDKSHIAQEAMRLRVLSPLLEARKMLMSDFDLTAFFSSVVEVTARESTTDYCAIYLADSAESALQAVAVHTNLEATRYFSGRSFPADKLAARCVELKRTVVLRRSNTTEASADDTVPGVVMAVPLLLGGKVEGALLLGRASLEKTFAQGERELFEIFAGQLATLVDNRRLFETLSKREERLRGFLGKFVSIQEEERKNISNHIQEGIIPALISSRQALQNYLGKVHSPSNQELLHAEQRLKEILGEAKNLVQTLRPTELDEYGLSAAVRRYVREISADPGIEPKPTFHLEGSEAPRMGSAVETALYRTFQEALNNACKHAKGYPISVLFRVEKSRNNSHKITIEISDQGKGFNTGALVSGEMGRQTGMVLMQERMAVIGGTCEIRSTPGRGTVVVLTYDTDIL